MLISLFAILILIVCIVLIVLFKQKLVGYFNNNFYFFLALLYISNLGYMHIIQLSLRCCAIALPWLYIFFAQQGKLKLKSCNLAKLTFLYLLFCLVSMTWSDSPIQTLFKSLELITDLIVIWELYSCGVSHETFVIKTIHLLMGTSAAILTITMTGFFLVPSYFANTGYSASHTILGIRIGDGLIGANQAGALAVLIFAWVILLTYKKNIWIYGILFVSMLSMLFSQSRSSLILIPVIILLRLFKPRSKYTTFYMIIIIGVCAIGIINIDLIYSYILRGQSISELTSLSGRKMMWSYAFEYIDKRPLFGYGFGAGGEMIGRILPGAFYGFQHMHNGVVETLLGTGVIGCVFILLQYFYIGINVFVRVTKTGIKNNLYEIILLLFFAIRTYTSLGVGSWQSLEIIVWYVLLFALSFPKVNIQISFKRQKSGKLYENRGVRYFT